MQEKIINVLVIVVMVVISLLPMYNSLQHSVGQAQDLIDQVSENIGLVRMEMVEWHQKLNSIKADIDKGLDQTKNVLNRVNELESDIDGLINKVDNIKLEAANKIEKIKEEPVEAIKDLFKIKG